MVVCLPVPGDGKVFIFVQALNWAIVALLVAERVPLAVPTLIAVLPIALALNAFRSHRSAKEKWGAVAANAIGALYYSWVALSSLFGANPDGLIEFATFFTCNILPCLLNTVYLGREIFMAPETLPPREIHSRGNW